MSRLSVLLVCLLVLLAGCAGGGGDGDATADATPAAGGDGSGGDSDSDADSDGGNGDSSVSTGTAGPDDMPDAVPLLREGERYEYEVRSAVLADAPESGTLTIDVTADGEWPVASMDAVRDAPSGRVEASGEAAAYSPALGEMTYALNVRSMVVTSRIVAGKSTDVRTYEVGETWQMASSDGEANFEVVGEEEVAGLTAKHVRVTGESDTDADIWLVSGVGYPAKFVQTEGGEATIELTLTAYERP
ncbi:DUF4412 domain-containing protein [Halopelagius fulvigenes]|uniref:DUF4412 domain-containing protein n=1 Tax=Halopelagius fulvigenes TaxID=1198324 RepID=A0ABD5U7R6_9EURY